MKRSVAIAISLLSLAVASFAEVAGERPVSDPAYGIAPGQRNYAAAASDGQNFLVAWIDVQRNRSNIISQVYASRMSAGGDALDPLDIRLPASQQSRFRISRVGVVFLGGSYLVYWLDVSPISPGWAAVMGARISRDGVLLDSAPRVLVNQADALSAHGAASNGNRTIVAAGNLMTVLDRDGNVVSGPKSYTGGTIFDALVTSNGHDFMVIWQQSSVIRSARFDENGNQLSTSSITTVSGLIALVDLASDGDGYVAVIDHGNGLVAHHIAATGEALETWPLPTQFSSVQHTFPGFVFTGGSYLLMDCDLHQNTIGARRLDHTGQPSGGYVPAVSYPCDGTTGTLASNGSGTGMFWASGDYWAESLNGAVMSGQALTTSKTSTFGHSAREQTNPAAATSGRNSAVVWNEYDGLYAGRIGIDGAMLDGRGIRISGRRSTTPPQIVYDGANYLIGWTEVSSATPVKQQVKLARVAPDSGVLLYPSGILVATGQCGIGGVTLSPGVTSTLVAWSDCTRVLATTASQGFSSGNLVTVTTTESTHSAGRVSAAWNGSEWLLAWQELIPHNNGPLDEFPSVDTLINASRLSSSLTVLDPAPIAVTNTLNVSLPFVASDGHSFLVAWSRSESTPPHSSTMIQRISSDGSLLAQANGVRLAPGNTKSVVWDGARYAVAISSFLDNGQGSPAYTLFVTHVAAAGSIESLQPLAFITTTIDPDASLIVTGTGSTAAVYTRVGSEAQYGDVERAFVSLPHTLRGRAAR